MKKLFSMILVICSLLSGNAYAKDLYTDLITKSKTGNGNNYYRSTPKVLMGNDIT